MEGLVLQILMIIAGVMLMAISVISLAKRKMTETFCLVWTLVAILLILSGFLLRPVGWTRYLSWTGLVLLILIAGCGIFCLYFLSCKLSEVCRKNAELATQVSILTMENKEIKKEIAELKEKNN